MCADCVAGSCHSSSHNDGWTCCGIESYTVKNHEYELNQIYKKKLYYHMNININHDLIKIKMDVFAASATEIRKLD